MAQIFRVERTKNFTVMSNHHFKNKNLTLKAKVLLSLMLSLPEDWNYNMQVIAWSKDKYNLFRQQVKDSFVADCAMAVLKALENCISKEKFIEKMKQFGWNVNWTEKRKHITFQNQDGKKVRDSNLSKTFHLDISKEELENEFDRNYERLRAEAERTNRADEELAGYYRQVETACERTGRNAGESDGGEGRVTDEKSEDERVYPGISEENP